MKNIKSFMLLFLMAVMLVFSVGTVLAQDVDLDSMDDAQLEELLKSIMQKLDTGDQAEETPEPELPEIPTPEPTAEAVRFEIYEIKKLTRSRLPDQLFVPKDDGKGDTDKDKDTGKNKDNDDDHGCQPWQTWVCYPLHGGTACECANG